METNGTLELQSLERERSGITGAVNAASGRRQRALEVELERLHRRQPALSERIDGLELTTEAQWRRERAAIDRELRALRHAVRDRQKSLHADAQ